jgi:S-adenosylmethionine decarboxylase
VLDTDQPQLVLAPAEFPDLAPSIHRQRLVVEGLVEAPLDERDIVDYLRALSVVCEMKVLQEPVTHRSDRYGWAGWVHWEASGAHFYAWNDPEPFFSVDLYTCRVFDPAAILDFTAEHFGTRRIVGRPF